jgi:Coenzyme PQQ synthesis protein D (PqqD)
MTERAFVRSPAVLSRTVAGEVLVTTVDQDQVDRLSPTAVAVWALLEEPATIDAVVDELARAFDAPRERIAGDVEGLLADLVRRGWVEEVPHR